MAVGGPGRLLPAGGGEDGRFPEGAPGVQQEQLQQIPCGFRLQGFQPPPLGVFAHQRIPLGTDHRDREDKHPPALPPPAVGQKECGQKTGSGAGGAGRGEFRAPPENRPDGEPGHDRGHLKLWEFPGNVPSAPSRFFCHLPNSHFFPPLSFIPHEAQTTRISRDPPYLFWDLPLSCFFFFFFFLNFFFLFWIFFFFNLCCGIFLWSRRENRRPPGPFFFTPPKIPFFLGFLGPAPQRCPITPSPKFHFSWDSLDLLLEISQEKLPLPQKNPLFLGFLGFFFFNPQNSIFPGIFGLCSLRSPSTTPHSQKSPFPGIPGISTL